MGYNQIKALKIGRQMSQVQCQQLLLNARRIAHYQLARIADLDIRLQTLTHTYSTLAVTLIAILQKQSSEASEKTQVMQGGQMREGAEVRELAQKIMRIEQQMDELSSQKVRLANSLYCSVSGSCEEMDEILWTSQQYQAYSKESQGLQADPDEIELAGLLKQCRSDQTLNYCVCQTSEQRELMIMCEGKSCPKRWYHPRCVGLSQDRLPMGSWFCRQCAGESSQ